MTHSAYTVADENLSQAHGAYTVADGNLSQARVFLAGATFIVAAHRQAGMAAQTAPVSCFRSRHLAASRN
jgi:hypothetical protein